MLSIFLNESISTMARSALMRVPIAIYLSRVYLLSRRFSRSSRRFSKISPTSSRKAPTFLEKGPTFFRTTRTFSSISQHLPLHTPHCPPLTDHTTGRLIENYAHKQGDFLGNSGSISISFANSTFQTLSIKHKTAPKYNRKLVLKLRFLPFPSFFCSKT